MRASMERLLVLLKCRIIGSSIEMRTSFSCGVMVLIKSLLSEEKKKKLPLLP